MHSIFPTQHSSRLGKICKTTLPNPSGKKLVLHCKAGKRGGMACEKLLTEDPNLELYNLEGGIDAWTQSGKETRLSGKTHLPLDRQVQLTIGIAVVTGIILGYWTHPWIPTSLRFFRSRSHQRGTHRLVWSRTTDSKNALEPIKQDTHTKGIYRG